MHDSVGHALTGLAIQLEKASAFRSRDAIAADGAVETAKRLADHALEEVRQAVGLLRAEQPLFLLSAGLRELAETADHAGLRVELLFSGDEAHIPVETRMALFRVAQEGLTNVQRHAQAAHVTLHLAIDADVIRLALRDDGIGFVPGTAPDGAGSRGGGYGLRGIAERVALLGGTYTLRSAPRNGTTLEVVAPTRGAAAAERMART